MFDAKDIKNIKELCKHIIYVQGRGRERIPGHIKRSGVFADCSMACEDAGCLAVKSRHILQIIFNDEQKRNS